MTVLRADCGGWRRRYLVVYQETYNRGAVCRDGTRPGRNAILIIDSIASNAYVWVSVTRDRRAHRPDSGGA